MILSVSNKEYLMHALMSYIIFKVLVSHTPIVSQLPKMYDIQAENIQLNSFMINTHAFFDSILITTKLSGVPEKVDIYMTEMN